MYERELDFSLLTCERLHLISMVSAVANVIAQRHHADSRLMMRNLYSKHFYAASLAYDYSLLGLWYHPLCERWMAVSGYGCQSNAAEGLQWEMYLSRL